MADDVLAEDLYLAYTPYNVFIATLLAMRSGPARDADLMIAPSFDCSAPLVRCLQHSAHSPFRQVILLDRSLESDPLSRRVLSQGWNARHVRGQVRRRRYRQVFAANPRRPESQAALYTLHQSWRDTSAFVIDEGLHSYSWEHFHLPAGRHWALFRKLFYGHWYRDLPGRRASISAPWCDARLLLFPEVTADIVAANETRPISPPNESERRQLGQLSAAYIAEYGVDQRQLEGIRHLIFARHSSCLNKHANYAARLREIVQQAHFGVALKLHPREPLPDPFGFGRMHNAVELPRQLGSEFLLLHPAMQPQTISGDLTSALVTARWLHPTVEIRLVETDDLPADQGVQKLLQRTLGQGFVGWEAAG